MYTFKSAFTAVVTALEYLEEDEEVNARRYVLSNSCKWCSKMTSQVIYGSYEIEGKMGDSECR